MKEKEINSYPDSHVKESWPAEDFEAEIQCNPCTNSMCYNEHWEMKPISLSYIDSGNHKRVYRDKYNPEIAVLIPMDNNEAHIDAILDNQKSIDNFIDDIQLLSPAIDRVSLEDPAEEYEDKHAILTHYRDLEKEHWYCFNENPEAKSIKERDEPELYEPYKDKRRDVLNKLNWLANNNLWNMAQRKDITDDSHWYFNINTDEVYFADIGEDPTIRGNRTRTINKIDEIDIDEVEPPWI